MDIFSTLLLRGLISPMKLPGSKLLGRVAQSKKSFRTLQVQKDFGGRDRDRTCYPLNANQVLSQMSYTPVP